MTLLRAAIVCTAVGTLITMALLLRETPYTLTAFMFLAQPLLVVGAVLFGVHVLRDLRRTGAL